MAQGFYFYFIVNLSPKERKRSFSDMARSEENAIEGKYNWGVMQPPDSMVTHLKH